MTTKYENYAEEFLNAAQSHLSEVSSYAVAEENAQLSASAQAFALMSIAESLLTLNKHLTEKEEGAR